MLAITSFFLQFFNLVKWINAVSFLQYKFWFFFQINFFLNFYEISESIRSLYPIVWYLLFSKKNFNRSKDTFYCWSNFYLFQHIKDHHHEETWNYDLDHKVQYRVLKVLNFVCIHQIFHAHISGTTVETHWYRKLEYFDHHL